MKLELTMKFIVTVSKLFMGMPFLSSKLDQKRQRKNYTKKFNQKTIKTTAKKYIKNIDCYSASTEL
jgi:hypothetical protein